MPAEERLVRVDADAPGVPLTGGLERADAAASRDVEDHTRSSGDLLEGDRPAALTRNSFRLPQLTTLDLSASKQFTIAGSNRVELRAEVFNLLNGKAVTGVNNTIGLDANNPPASFGQVTNRQGAIEGQLSIRYRF